MSRMCDYCGRFTDNFHRFPDNPVRAKDWASRLDWELEEIGKKTFHLCNMHFADHQFVNNDKNGNLKAYAVPETTLSLTNVDSTSYFPDIQELDEPPRLERMDGVVEELSDGYESPMKKAKLVQLSQESQESVITGFSSQTISSQDIFSDGAEDDSALSNNYYLLDVSSLKSLLEFFNGCPKCQSNDCHRSFRSEGTTVVISTDCPECGSWTWSSTIRAHSDPLGSYYSGNLDYISSTYVSGIAYERLCDMSQSFNLGIPNRTTYFEVVNSYVKPVIDTEYEKMMRDAVKTIKEENPGTDQVANVSILGDAQYDSPGFSASICRYTAMDAKTKIVVDYQILHRKQSGGNSPILERKGFEKVLERLLASMHFEIQELTTDQNKAVLAFTRASHPDLNHRIDKWHVIKNFKKLYETKLKAKKYAALNEFWQHLLVHIWISISAADGDSELAVELIQSAYYHLQGIHHFPGKFKLIDGCPHGPLTGKTYLNKKDHRDQLRLLWEMLHTESFLTAVRLCSPENTTSALESFHSMVSGIYLTKRQYFGLETSESLMKLAILHQNSHRMEIIAHRKAVEAEEKKIKIRTKYSRAQKRIVEVPRHPPPTLNFKRAIVSETKQRYCEVKEYMKDVRQTGRRTQSNDQKKEEGKEQGKEKGVEDLQKEKSTTLEPKREIEVDDSELEEEMEEEVERGESETVVRPVSLAVSTRSAMPKPEKKRMYVKKSELRRVVRELGEDANDYEFYDARTEEPLLPC